MEVNKEQFKEHKRCLDNIPATDDKTLEDCKRRDPWLIRKSGKWVCSNSKVIESECEQKIKRGCNICVAYTFVPEGSTV